MNFEEVRRTMGKILGESVPPGGFEQSLLQADRQGRVGSKQVLRMIMVLYAFLEEIYAKPAREDQKTD